MVDAVTRDAERIGAAVDPEFLDDPLGDVYEWYEPAPAPALSRIPASAGLAMELEFGVGSVQDLDEAVLEDVLISYARMTAWAQANQARVLAEVARRAAADPRRRAFVVDEVASTLHLSGVVAGAQLARAVVLDAHLVATRRAWEQGLLDERRVVAIVDGTQHVSAEVAAQVEARVLLRAPEQTAAQLRAAVRRGVISADPEGAQERHDRARSKRRVDLYPEADGMVTLAAITTAANGVACYEWLTRLARGLGRTIRGGWMPAARICWSGRSPAGSSPARSMTTRRWCGRSARANPSCRSRSTSTPLLRGPSTPADLVGYGPITAAAAREVDHTKPFPHGPTSAANLHSLCTRYHHLKHESEWTVVALPGGGLKWTSPTGRTYTVGYRDHRSGSPPTMPPPGDGEPPPF